jgi:hypothetical protein
MNHESTFFRNLPRPALDVCACGRVQSYGTPPRALEVVMR